MGFEYKKQSRALMNNLKILITKLSTPARTALEQSANFCIAQQHYEIEIEHLLYELLQQSEKNDLIILVEKYKIPKVDFIDDLNQSLSYLTKGNTRTPIFAKSIVQLLEQAWLLASAEQNPLIRSSHLLLAVLIAPDLYQLAIRASSLFDLFLLADLKHKYLDYCQDSIEQQSSLEPHQDPLFQSKIDTVPAESQSATPALDQYTINLTEKALSGGIDPVIGRELEIRLMLDILMRRRQNNPILVGEPGVGKTAIVEGLALKIISNQVPTALRNVQLHLLDLGLLQAGASVKGEFENRLKRIVKEVQSASHPIILFIDEAHSLIGAGGQTGQNDAANLLKPALARGELRTIAATTWAEYKQYFEKDAALSRRFQLIKIEEPSLEVATDMLRAMVPTISKHFKLQIDDEAIITAVNASHRYMSGRQLPDKALSVLDTAAARVALTQNAQPIQLDQLVAIQHNLQLELNIIAAEHQYNPIYQSRIKNLKLDLSNINQEITTIKAKWKTELGLVQQIQCMETQLGEDASEALEQKVKIDQIKMQLHQVQANQPLVFPRVNSDIVREIIADWTGIPISNMVSDEIKQVLSLENKLAQRIKGQIYALKQLVQGIKTAKAKLEDPHKSQGVFLLVGPSGVGKTETALALAHELYGGESHLITINMSEYQEAHRISSLKGAPPGYVGYGQGGILTEAVRRNPYSVVLLDEIEKAHIDVQELFYQVFDKGMLEDSEGRLIDFRNTIILATSNIGSNVIMQTCLNHPVEQWPDAEDIMIQLKPYLYKQFKAAFLGRMRIVPYYPLYDDLLIEIIKEKLEKIINRVQQTYQVQIKYTDELLELLLNRCTEVDSGARNIDHILNATILPALATEILCALSEHKLPKHIYIKIENEQIFYQLDPHTVEKNHPPQKLKKAKVL